MRKKKEKFAAEMLFFSFAGVTIAMCVYIGLMISSWVN